MNDFWTGRRFYLTQTGMDEDEVRPYNLCILFQKLTMCSEASGKPALGRESTPPPISQGTVLAMKSSGSGSLDVTSISSTTAADVASPSGLSGAGRAPHHLPTAKANPP